MRNFLLKVLITALSLLAVAYVVPGFEVTGFYPALIAALFLGILNAIVRPILILLTLPITILTLGLFIFIINAGIVLFVASFVDGFEVSGLFAALVGSILVSLVSGVVNRVLE
jgi:putative membrane protein